MSSGETTAGTRCVVCGVFFVGYHACGGTPTLPATYPIQTPMSCASYGCPERVSVTETWDTVSGTRCTRYWCARHASAQVWAHEDAPRREG